MGKQSKGIIIEASIGALAGVIAGILLAPKSGKETRADISNYIHEMKDEIADELGTVGNVTKEAYNGIVDKIVKVYETAKKITAEDADDIRKKLDDNYGAITKTINVKKATEVKKAA